MVGEEEEADSDERCLLPEGTGLGAVVLREEDSLCPSMWHGGSGACTAASQQEGPGSIPAWGAVGTGGRFSPGLQCSGGLSPGPLCGVCMFSLCSQGVSSTKMPKNK